jgi:hypothetical protein
VLSSLRLPPVLKAGQHLTRRKIRFPRRCSIESRRSVSALACRVVEFLRHKTYGRVIESSVASRCRKGQNRYTASLKTGGGGGKRKDVRLNI